MPYQIQCPTCGRYAPDYVEVSVQRVTRNPKTGKPVTHTTTSLIGGGLLALACTFFGLVGIFQEVGLGNLGAALIALIFLVIGILCLAGLRNALKTPKSYSCHCTNCGKRWSIQTVKKRQTSERLKGSEDLPRGVMAIHPDKAMAMNEDVQALMYQLSWAEAVQMQEELKNLISQERWIEALQKSEALLKGKMLPTEVQAAVLNCRGVCYYALKRYAEAEDAYTDALLRDDPLHFDRITNQARNQLMWAADTRGEERLSHLRKALGYAQTAQTIRPNNQELQELMDTIREFLEEVKRYGP